jgi:hypothetical protein
VEITNGGNLMAISHNSTATVTTLTAEVRVLMVGARQITSGVYDQLDYVESEYIEPFGRVRPRNGTSNLIYVVGRRMESTDLVKSRCGVEHDIYFEDIRADSLAFHEAKESLTRAQVLLETATKWIEHYESELGELREIARQLASGELTTVTLDDRKQLIHPPAGPPGYGPVYPQQGYTYRALRENETTETLERVTSKIHEHEESVTENREKVNKLAPNVDDLEIALATAQCAWSTRREYLIGLARRWSELPLIVLAGLR